MSPTRRVRLSRGEFEQQLVDNEELRGYVLRLGEAAREMREMEKRFEKSRAQIHGAIYDLVELGAPKALLARRVGLSPQRINSIVQEQAKKRGKAKR